MTVVKRDLIESDNLTTTRPSPLAQIHSPKRLLVAGFGVGLAAELLLFGKPLGVGLFIFVCLTLGMLWRIGRLEGVTAERRNLWLIFPLLFFSIMVFLRANSYLTVLNVIAVMSLLAYLLFFWSTS